MLLNINHITYCQQNSLDFQQDGEEFQQFIKPCQIICHDSKEFSMSKIKKSYVKLESDEICPQDDTNSSLTDVIIQSNVNGENYSMKMIGPTEECLEVTSVNTQILTEAPLLENVLKDVSLREKKHLKHFFQIFHE